MQNLKWRALEALGFGADAFAGEMRLAAQGNRSASIAGVKAVRRYTPDCLRVQVLGGVVQIDGYELMLKAICAGVVEVCGRIESIAFFMDAQQEEA